MASVTSRFNSQNECIGLELTVSLSISSLLANERIIKFSNKQNREFRNVPNSHLGGWRWVGLIKILSTGNSIKICPIFFFLISKL
jgi:hypothetical protein